MAELPYFGLAVMTGVAIAIVLRSKTSMADIGVILIAGIVLTKVSLPFTPLDKDGHFSFSWSIPYLFLGCVGAAIALAYRRSSDEER